jgi:hypothetical protein
MILIFFIKIINIKSSSNLQKIKYFILINFYIIYSNVEFSIKDNKLTLNIIFQVKKLIFSFKSLPNFIHSE